MVEMPVVKRKSIAESDIAAMSPPIDEIPRKSVGNASPMSRSVVRIAIRSVVLA